MMRKLLTLGLLLNLLSSNAQSIRGQDGYDYKTTIIGEQVWFAENLRTSIYNDGTVIPLIKTSEEWVNLTSSGRCWYQNDSSKYLQNGQLYNYYAVKSKKLCPVGWHVPDLAEWDTLAKIVGGIENVADLLKEEGYLHWGTANLSKDSLGFSALPSGIRSSDGSFSDLGFRAWWWTSKQYSAFDAYAYNLDVNDLRWGFNNMQHGASVRCISDYLVTGTNNINEKNISIVNFYPNPTTGKIWLQEEVSEIIIYDTLGEVTIMSSNTRSLDISNLPNGLYQLSLRFQNGNNIIHKLIKK